MLLPTSLHAPKLKKEKKKEEKALRILMIAKFENYAVRFNHIVEKRKHSMGSSLNHSNIFNLK